MTANGTMRLAPDRQTIREAAIAYASLGYGVFTLHRNQKTPISAHGLKDAVWTPEDARALFAGSGTANLAVLPPANVIVFDVDDPDKLSTLLDTFPELAVAPMHATPRGAHLFTRLPTGVLIPARTKAVEGVDLRGMGKAYLVAPPSRVDSVEYTVVRPLVAPADLPLASDSLLEYLAPTPKPRTASKARQARNSVNTYARAALDQEVERVVTTTEGSRNDALNVAAFSLGQLVGGGELSKGEVEVALADAALAAGLDPNEITATIHSGVKAGMLEPRTAPPSAKAINHHAIIPRAESADGAEHAFTYEDLVARARATITLDEVGDVLSDLTRLADGKAKNSQRDAVFQALKTATGVTLKSLRADYARLLPDDERGQSATISEQLLTLVLERVTLWHDLDGEPFITLKLDTHQEHHRLGTRAVKRWLQRLWHEESDDGGTVGREPLSEVLGVLEGMAIHDGAEHETFIRVGEVDEGPDTTIYVDMADDACHAIRVTAQGWSIITSDAVPVHFIRSGGMLPLPTPEPGAVADISAALGIPHLEPDTNTPHPPFQGAVAWLLQAFRVRGPFPVLPLFGQQGSGKSTFTRHICGLVDPHSATLRVLSRDERDILISARHSWLQAKDNVSTLTQWTSDAFCRLATGGAISTRRLYSDDEEVVLNAKRPVLLNGITSFLERQDLVDRSIAVTLPAIPEDQRLPESDLDAEYERRRPKALGALLDIVSTGLARSGERRFARLPRMADFATWIVACSPALDWDPEHFLNWFANTKNDLVREALDSSAITPALLKLLADRGGELELSPADLLGELNHVTGHSDGKRPPAGWPKRAQSLSNELRRIQPALLQAEGIQVEHGRTNKGKLWRLHNNEKTSALAAPAPWLLDEARPERETSGADEPEAHRHSSALIGTSAELVPTSAASSAPQETRLQRQSADSADSADHLPTLPVPAALRTRASRLVKSYTALPVDTLRTKYADSAARADAPDSWSAIAKLEPVAVTVALTLLAADRAAQQASPAGDYLNAARAAVEAPR